jgi:aspartate-semialdehyde dehydrogenase
MKDDAVIILDPVNMPVIKNALAKGGKNWIGGNCTVLHADGRGRTVQGGSGGMDEHRPTRPHRVAARSTCASADPVRHAQCRGQGLLDDPKSAILEIDRKVIAKQRASLAPKPPTLACRWADR